MTFVNLLICTLLIMAFMSAQTLLSAGASYTNVRRTMHFVRTALCQESAVFSGRPNACQCSCPPGMEPQMVPTTWTNVVICCSADPALPEQGNLRPKGIRVGVSAVREASGQLPLTAQQQALQCRAMMPRRLARLRERAQPGGRQDRSRRPSLRPRYC